MRANLDGVTRSLAPVFQRPMAPYIAQVPATVATAAALCRLRGTIADSDDDAGRRTTCACTGSAARDWHRYIGPEAGLVSPWCPVRYVLDSHFSGLVDVRVFFLSARKF
jgi:hypothetical protein